MSKEMMVIALGVWIIVVPYLGVPGTWRTAILVITGIVIAIVGFLLRGEALLGGTRRTENQSFVEHIPQPRHDESQKGISSLN